MGARGRRGELDLSWQPWWARPALLWSMIGGLAGLALLLLCQLVAGAGGRRGGGPIVSAEQFEAQARELERWQATHGAARQQAAQEEMIRAFLPEAERVKARELLGIPRPTTPQAGNPGR